MRLVGRTPTYHLYDRLMNGRLGSTLLAWKAEGVSQDEMAFRLRAEGIAVSRETIRRWVKDLEAAA